MGKEYGNETLESKKHMRSIFRICLLLGGTLLLCNNKLQSDNPPSSTMQVKSIMEVWKDEPVSPLPSKPPRLEEYGEEATLSLQEELRDVLFGYGRTSGEGKQYYHAVNSCLDDYITTRFYSKAFVKSLEEEELEFALDTFRIEETCRFILSGTGIDDNSYLSRSFTYRFYAEEYLIYKYYTKVMQLLKEEDKVVLEASQEQWEKSLHADWEVENAVMDEKYTGGGSIWKNIDYADKRPRSEFLFRIYLHLRGLGL